MSKAISGTTKKRGRPKTTGAGTSINVRLLGEPLSALDALIAEQGDAPSRPELIRRLVIDGLVARGYLKPKDQG